MQIHQKQMRDEEFEALQRQREIRRQGLDSCEKSATVVAVCLSKEVPDIEDSLLLTGKVWKYEWAQLLMLCCLAHLR